MCNHILIQIVSVKVIRNKRTGLSEGYGFLEFLSHDVADKVLKKFNGTYMPKTDRPFRLNWASSSTGEENEHESSIYVGNLAPDVSDSLLHSTFSEIYLSVKDAKVVIEAYTGRSKGFGFVRFRDVNERTKAMTEMHGVKCSNRAMRIGPATPRETISYPQQGFFRLSSLAGMYMTNGAITCPSGDATIFVGGLDSSVTSEDLKQPFSAFGEIVSVKIPLGKEYGFVQFVNRQNAEALKKLNGTVIGNHRVRLSWGQYKLPRYNYGNQWSGAYYVGQHYNGYGYMVPQPHDPIMYAVAPYGGYPVYGGPQERKQKVAHIFSILGIYGLSCSEKTSFDENCSNNLRETWIW
ncbi:polyadenylate-binding protein RBP47C-like [Raphanus sativus]|uniref:Polyadenylate-binding protein RBP47C-like n=1 Tax=Raphanus sativus TaxID=3726 RepID=A0A9W3C488_RAPSA|nr:polyadenylate-binding protein RBP47C-like [Raphanus sativus]